MVIYKKDALVPQRWGMWLSQAVGNVVMEGILEEVAALNHVLRNGELAGEGDGGKARLFTAEETACAKVKNIPSRSNLDFEGPRNRWRVKVYGLTSSRELESAKYLILTYTECPLFPLIPKRLNVQYHSALDSALKEALVWLSPAILCPMG